MNIVSNKDGQGMDKVVRGLSLAIQAHSIAHFHVMLVSMNHFLWIKVSGNNVSPSGSFLKALRSKKCRSGYRYVCTWHQVFHVFYEPEDCLVWICHKLWFIIRGIMRIAMPKIAVTTRGGGKENRTNRLKTYPKTFCRVVIIHWYKKSMQQGCT